MSIAPYPKRGLVVSRHDPSRIVGRMTLDEYVAFERDSLEKHELLDGEVVRMAGGSPEHNRIRFDAGRTFAEAFDAAKINCDVYGSDQKVFITRKLAYYPDVIVVCSEAQFDERDMLRNPAVIVEVLSPSTAAFDRGGKFRQYRTVSSLRHILFIEQDRPIIEHYERDAAGAWTLRGEYDALGQNLELTVSGHQISLPLSKIYRNIVFPAVAPSATDPTEE